MFSKEIKELKAAEFIFVLVESLFLIKPCQFKRLGKYNGIIFSEDPNIIFTLSKDQTELSVWDGKEIETDLPPHVTLSVIQEDIGAEGKDILRLSVILYPKEDTPQDLKNFLGKLITDAQLILSLYCSKNLGDNLIYKTKGVFSE